MTSKPGSVTKRRGHLRVRKYSLRKMIMTSGYHLSLLIYEHNSVSGYVLGGGYNSYKTFFCTPGGVYYVYGNQNVWKTDIANIGDAIFDPVCKEKGRVVNFRKLHKLEWLFG